MGFFNKYDLTVKSANGRNVQLLEELTYTTTSGEVIKVPYGFISDGASVPQAYWNVIPPFGKYWLAAIVHDYLYQCSDKTKTDCDYILKEAMEALNVPTVELDTIFEAVNFFGHAAFNQDRAGR